MKLYNTLTQQVEPFTVRQQPITLYVCGITPYDTTHLGHAFTYTAVDILLRYLEWQGNTVHYVQNVTDIDDDILRKVKAVGEDWRTLGNRWTRHFIEDMISLNVRPPDHYPRATSVIGPIIELVTALVDHGVAYAAGGNVYFAVDAWPDYGKLSHIARREMLPIANERGNLPADPHKRAPLDFVLWQAQAPDEPAWASPWGTGRPGWHIECSTMSTSLLGDTIDLHSGGADLIFPHHECEIAQVEGATGQKPFVRYWFHTAMVEHEGAKMSKSLGNLVMARDLLQNYTADALRLYMAGHHYRAPWHYAESQLAQAQQLAQSWLAAGSVVGGTGTPVNPAAQADRFCTALNNNLDTTSAITALTELAAAIRQGGQRGQAVQAAQAIIATNRSGGPPQLTPVWYIYEAGKLYISAGLHTAKVRNLRADPAVTICVDGGHPDARYVIFQGQITIIEPNDPQQEAMRWRIIRHYDTDEAEARRYYESMRAAPSVLLVLQPDKIISQDFNAD